MTNERKKRYLSQYRENEKELARLQKQMGGLRQRQCEALGWSFADMPNYYRKSCVKGDSAHTQQQILRQQIAQGLRLQSNIKRAIELVEDERLQQILELRYIEGLTIVKTAEQMAYSTRQIDNLLVTALHQLKLNYIS